MASETKRARKRQIAVDTTMKVCEICKVFINNSDAEILKHKLTSCEYRLVSCPVTSCSSKFASKDKCSHFKKFHKDLKNTDYDVINVRPSHPKDAILRAKMDAIGIPVNNGEVHFRFGYVAVMNMKVGTPFYVFSWNTKAHLRPLGAVRRCESTVQGQIADRFLPPKLRFCEGDWREARKSARHFTAGHLRMWNLAQTDDFERVDNMLSTNFMLMYSTVNSSAYSKIESGILQEIRKEGQEQEVGSIQGACGLKRMVACTIGKQLPLFKFVYAVVIIYNVKKDRWYYDAWILPNHETCSEHIGRYRKTLEQMRVETSFDFGFLIKEKLQRVNILGDDPAESNSLATQLEPTQSISTIPTQEEETVEYWKNRCLAVEQKYYALLESSQ